jgi:hypothetical protein
VQLFSRKKNTPLKNLLFDAVPGVILDPLGA